MKVRQNNQAHILAKSPFTEDYVVPRLIYDPNILYEGSLEQQNIYPRQSPFTEDYVVPRLMYRLQYHNTRQILRTDEQ
jgi:hypothetical protein